jgi:hypothetical protein
LPRGLILKLFVMHTERKNFVNRLFELFVDNYRILRLEQLSRYRVILGFDQAADCHGEIRWEQGQGLLQ